MMGVKEIINGCTDIETALTRAFDSAYHRDDGYVMKCCGQPVAVDADGRGRTRRATCTICRVVVVDVTCPQVSPVKGLCKEDAEALGAHRWLVLHDHPAGVA